MTVIIGFNYLASFLITGMARDYMFLIMNLCMVLPVLLPILMNRKDRSDRPNSFHSKTEAAVLLLFSLQKGLCFFFLLKIVSLPIDCSHSKSASFLSFW